MEHKMKVFEILRGLGIEYSVINHPAVYTIDEMNSILSIVDAPWVVKNLFLRNAKGNRHFLIIMDKEKKADLKNLQQQLGTSSLSFASEERLMKYLKLSKGSVTPLGIINDDDKAVEIVIEGSLVGREKIGVHPNDNTSTVMLSYHDLCRVIEDNGNPMHIIDL